MRSSAVVRWKAIDAAIPLVIGQNLEEKAVDMCGVQEEQTIE